jgi:enediyne biosynthesis protein E4
LFGVGLITGAQWADFNGDKLADLAITGEWMPLIIFLSEKGKLVNRTKELGLGKTNGWYNTLMVADVNGDGFPDIVAGNHGMNSRFRASESQPVQLYVNDFDRSGSVEQILTRYDNGESYPLVLRHDLIAQIPSLKKKYLYFKNYTDQKMNDIFPAEILDRSIVLNAYSFETSIWINRAGKSFEKRILPIEAQFSPVYAILPDDFDRDGKIDLLLGGNLHRAKPETGIYNASYGLMLRGDGEGNFSTVPARSSGVRVRGEIRSIVAVKTKKGKLVVFGKNNDNVEFLRY